MEENSAKEITSSIQISEEAIAAIAGLAATDIDGVASMAGNLTNELIAKLGIVSASKGVQINMGDDCVSINLSLNVEYGCCIPEVCQLVSDKVRDQVENMTGLSVTEVNVHIAGINMKNN